MTAEEKDQVWNYGLYEIEQMLRCIYSTSATLSRRFQGGLRMSLLEARFS